jgi:GH18 family chitinase
VGSGALVSNTTGFNNTTLGASALGSNTTGLNNTAIGLGAMGFNQTGNNNTAVGLNAGRTDGRNFVNTTGRNSVFIGAETKSLWDPNSQFNQNIQENQIVIGYQAVGRGSNTIQLGNNQIQTVNTYGDIIARSFKIQDGSSSDYLMADGSVSNVTALVREVADEFSADAAQTDFILTQIPSVNSKVKMYINGIRISNTAYTISGDTLTYNPTNNGGYALSEDDRIQFDYYY